MISPKLIEIAKGVRTRVSKAVFLEFLKRIRRSRFTIDKVTINNSITVTFYSIDFDCVLGS